MSSIHSVGSSRSPPAGLEVLGVAGTSALSPSLFWERYRYAGAWCFVYRARDVIDANIVLRKTLTNRLILLPTSILCSMQVLVFMIRCCIVDCRLIVGCREVISLPWGYFSTCYKSHCECLSFFLYPVAFSLTTISFSLAALRKKCLLFANQKPRPNARTYRLQSCDMYLYCWWLVQLPVLP